MWKWKDPKQLLTTAENNPNTAQRIQNNLTLFEMNWKLEKPKQTHEKTLETTEHNRGNVKQQKKYEPWQPNTTWKTWLTQHKLNDLNNLKQPHTTL